MKTIKGQIIFLMSICLALVSQTGASERPGTLLEAQTQAAAEGKEILLEFHRQDCEHCGHAAKDAEENGLVKIALTTVVHFPVDAQSEDGRRLAEQYRAGFTYPVFVLADESGNEIVRWIGYVGADQFVMSLNAARNDLTTIPERETRLAKAPDPLDASFLAKHYERTREYLQAAECYRILQGQVADTARYSYKMFLAMVEASWNGDLPFDSVLDAADLVMKQFRGDAMKLGQMAKLVVRLARKYDMTYLTESYLMAGAEATSIRQDHDGVKLHRELLADYALHIKHDTVQATAVAYKFLGADWEKDPRRCFEYGQWCLERMINLDQAEKYVQRAADMAQEPIFKARHLKVLAEVIRARGRLEEAIEVISEAARLDPSNAWYEKLLAEMKAEA